MNAENPETSEMRKTASHPLESYPPRHRARPLVQKMIFSLCHGRIAALWGFSGTGVFSTFLQTPKQPGHLRRLAFR